MAAAVAMMGACGGATAADPHGGGDGGGSGSGTAPDAGAIDVGATTTADATAGGDDTDAGPTEARAEPTGRAFTAAGVRSASTRFVLLSATGEATPVGDGAETSSEFSLSPGILGGGK